MKKKKSFSSLNQRLLCWWCETFSIKRLSLSANTHTSNWMTHWLIAKPSTKRLKEMQQIEWRDAFLFGFVEFRFFVFCFTLEQKKKHLKFLSLLSIIEMDISNKMWKFLLQAQHQPMPPKKWLRPRLSIRPKRWVVSHHHHHKWHQKLTMLRHRPPYRPQAHQATYPMHLSTNITGTVIASMNESEPYWKNHLIRSTYDYQHQSQPNKASRRTDKRRRRRGNFANQYSNAKKIIKLPLFLSICMNW